MGASESTEGSPGRMVSSEGSEGLANKVRKSAVCV